MKILVTAFDPFGEDTLNAALLAVEKLPSEVAGVQVFTVVVPTEFAVAGAWVADLIASLQPDAVLCVGQAAGTAAVAVERIAINLNDARIPDNAGQQPIDEPIVAGGANAYFATLPVKAMVKAARDAGVAAELSHSAGTFVCNNLMYSVLHKLAEAENNRVRAGFVHVPSAPEQLPAGGKSLETAAVVEALCAMIAAIAAHDTDISSVEGAIS